MPSLLCAGRAVVLGAQFSETVFPAEASQQPGSPFAGGAIASGELGWQVESLDRRREVSHGRVGPNGVLGKYSFRELNLQLPSSSALAIEEPDPRSWLDALP